MPVISKRTGTGEAKKSSQTIGKTDLKAIPKQDNAKTYHKNPDTGKMEEYPGIEYQDDKSKPMKPNPHQDSINDVLKSHPSVKSRASFEK